MKEITIISGKGGTGKTSITAALACLGKKQVLCDADVDAADLHMILEPQIRETHVFEGAWLVNIDQTICASCGICTEYCRFDAIEIDDKGLRRINPYACEGCRLCERICPSKAIHSERSTNNFWYISETRAGIMIHASMGPGEENSGKLVTRVRNKAREIAKKTGARFILTDGPPGTGCAAISSITGTDVVLLVMESSKSSLHDAQRLIELVRQFKIPIYAIINKSDINEETTAEIEAFLIAQSIPLLAWVPFDEEIVWAMLAGQSIHEYNPLSSIARNLSDAGNKLFREITVLEQ